MVVVVDVDVEVVEVDEVDVVVVVDVDVEDVEVDEVDVVDVVEEYKPGV